MLNLVVPGLLWPKDSIGEISRGLPLPALGALLGRGRRIRRSAQPFEHWLFHTFGLQGGEIPFGALRLLGEGLDPGKDAWMCADPVHLRFSRGTLIVDAARPELSLPEAKMLVVALNDQLAGFGEFLAPHPQRWYIRTSRVPRIATHVLSTVIGRTIEPFLPLGEEARYWRHLINEAQVLLHNHSLNMAREAAGKPTVNSLWLWGAGSLPTRVFSPVRHVYSDNPLARGLAKLAGIQAAPIPERAQTAAPHSLTLLENLHIPAQSLDAAAWRDGLEELEARWFAPSLAALKAHRLNGLRLTALGDNAVVEITLDAGDLWQFWRQPRQLADL